MTSNAREIIEEQQAEIERLTTAPRIAGTIIEVTPTDCLVATSNGVIVVQTPPPPPLKPGDRVLVSEGGAIVGALDFDTVLGAVHAVTDIDANGVYIERGGQRVVISAGMQADIAQGDKVIVDDTGSVAIKTIKVEKKHVTARVAATSWDDIAGQEAAKQALREAVELPLLHPKLFAAYNKAPVKGVLLYGPPGCGKTMLGKALAHSLEGGFVYVKGPELLDSYVGQSEANVRDIFTSARRYETDHGKPAVIFIDEADALLGVRGAHFSGMEKTIVPMFLTEMDGLEQTSAIVILATNRPDQLDPAVTREGRIDRKIKVERPDMDTARTLFEMYLARSFCALDSVELAAHANALLWTDQFPMYQVQAQSGEHVFHLRHLISGALVANVVEQATSLALGRDIDAGCDPSGINHTDVVAAVHTVYHQNRDLHHDEALADLVGHCTIHSKEKLRVTAAA